MSDTEIREQLEGMFRTSAYRQRSTWMDLLLMVALGPHIPAAHLFLARRPHNVRAPNVLASLADIVFAHASSSNPCHTVCSRALASLLIHIPGSSSLIPSNCLCSAVLARLNAARPR